MEIYAEFGDLKAEAVPATDWEQASLSDLIEFIQTRYHAPLADELASLQEKANQVAQAHGQDRAGLVKVAQLVCTLREELLSHTRKEDMILFPWIRDMELGYRSKSSLDGPVGMMKMEHQDADVCLQALRTATDDYLLPRAACTTYRTLFSELVQLERKLHEHIHLENSVLFPRAIAMTRT